MIEINLIQPHNREMHIQGSEESKCILYILCMLCVIFLWPFYK